MGPGQSSTWSGNLDPGKFTFSWNTQKTSITYRYAEPFKPCTTYSWKLNPASPGTEGFADPTGTPLMVTSLNDGDFTTGPGSETNDKRSPP